MRRLAEKILIMAVIWMAGFQIAFGADSPRPPTEKPNIVLVFLDDCGYGDFSHTGNPSIRSPNISRMVRQGATFPQFYCASPACTASRYALLTGRNPRRSGFNDWVFYNGDEKYIHPQEVTIAERLKGQGYATAMFGKWHLGMPTSANNYSTNSLPLAHGFDMFIGTTLSNDGSGSLLLEAPSTDDTPVEAYRQISNNVKNDDALQSGLTKQYSRAAVDFIRAHRADPFFVYLAYNMPHLPVNPGPEFQGQSPRGPLGDVIEEIDHYVGEMLELLEDEGIAENTLVILTSDNGPWIRFYYETGNSYYGDARLEVGHARPFRDGKGSTWEGGMRVPGVMYWPGTIEPSTVVENPSSTLDIMPTVVALAGGSAPSDRSIDGRDIRRRLNPDIFSSVGAPSEFVFMYSGSPDNRIRASRKGAWKIHTSIYSQLGTNYGFSASVSNPLLFNVEQDVGETRDYSGERPDIVQELLDERQSFLDDCAAEGTFWD